MIRAIVKNGHKYVSIHRRRRPKERLRFVEYHIPLKFWRCDFEHSQPSNENQNSHEIENEDFDMVTDESDEEWKPPVDEGTKQLKGNREIQCLLAVQ